MCRGYSGTRTRSLGLVSSTELPTNSGAGNGASFGASFGAAVAAVAVFFCSCFFCFAAAVRT